jgi:putative ABC transport system substrate-binding protein
MKFVNNKILLFLLLFIFLDNKIFAEKTVLILYRSSVLITSIVKNGIISKLPKSIQIDLDKDSSKFNDLSASEYDIILPIGQIATKKAIEKESKKPVIFSLVMAPKFLGYNKYNNITGISMNIAAEEFYNPLKEILPKGSRIGIIYKSDISNYISTEVYFIESRYGFKSVRIKVPDRDELTSVFNQMIDKHKIQAFWMLPDPIFNTSIFNKLSNLCIEKKVLLITTFKPLVTHAKGALAIAPSYFEMGIQTAELAQKILNGFPLTNSPIQRPAKTGLYINKDVIKKLGIKLPKSIITREKTTKLFEQAQEAYAKGENQTALGFIKQILKLNKNHTGALWLRKKCKAYIFFYQGEKYLKEGKTVKAVGFLIKAALDIPEARSKLAAIRSKLKPQIKKMIDSGTKAYHKEEYLKCISIMNTVLDIDPANKIAKTFVKKAREKYKAISSFRQK